ncbi:MAG TPA: prolyl oligopeptidase family serine peptidase [Vicinamibacterales bacterium]|nr:prolyl oligopeptidase family serine peptidase [Vicinamibacterales bacterium]
MRRTLAAAAALLCLSLALSAQSTPPLTPADYGQWESLSLPFRNALSPDGAWLAHSISRSNRQNELRLRRLADETTVTVPFGGQPTFTTDSRWAAYSIGHPPAEQERLRTARQPIQNRLGLANLSTGETTAVDGIQSFALSRDGRFVAMRRYAPQPAGAAGTPPPPAGGRGGRGGAAPEADRDPIGTTLIVRTLATGEDTAFGNVGEIAWQDSPAGHLLAMTIAADGRSGNGVHLFDLESGRLRVLDSGAAVFSGLSWRDGAPDLAVLRSRDDETRDGPTHTIIAWQRLGASDERRVTFDHGPSADVPAGMRVVPFRAPSWSDDGRVVFTGVAPWAARPAAPGRGRGAGGRDPGSGGDGARGTNAAQATSPPEPADVDVWHWRDATVMPRQKTGAVADRRRSRLAAWHLEPNRLVILGQSDTEQVTPVDGTPFALVEDWSAFQLERSIGRPAADLSLIDLDTGRRTLLRERVDDRYVSASPGGRYVLLLAGGHWWTINLATRAAVNITTSIRTSFVDTESDQTSPLKPPFGVAGWTDSDAHVLLYDRFDVWRVSPSGSGGTRLTDGASGQVRHRVVTLDAEADTIDLGAATYVSLFGLRSKHSGYGMLQASGGVERLVYEDASVTSLTRAKDVPVFAFVSQRHDDSPDVFVAGAVLADARPVTTTNPFQSNFAWSRSEIVDYRSEKGVPLQGALYYPAGYEAGRAYPMVVYLYETLSDNVHRYVAPSATSYYNTTVFTSQGYFVFQPDIVFRPREPGLSVVECVRPAVKAVVDKGLVDARRVGVVGHSWGGFDAAFLAARTTTFAASVAGAPITNLVSNYGNHHWSSGIAETDHIETGQQRMEVPIYEDLDAYIRNSAVFGISTMTTPLLLMTGDNDGTVYWHQSVEFYNIARRAEKNVVMLVYNNEDHGLRVEKNQTDYQQRILDWFGHYLKGEPPKTWIANGRTFLEREGR